MQATVRLGRSGQIVVPLSIRQIMNMAEGDIITIDVLEVHKYPIPMKGPALVTEPTLPMAEPTRGLPVTEPVNTLPMAEPVTTLPLRREKRQR